MYENGKMSPVETIPGIGGGRIKENDGGVKSTMICCKNFCKCHKYPKYYNNITKKKINFKLKKKVRHWVQSRRMQTLAL
jgi:hypothetical protein